MKPLIIYAHPDKKGHCPEILKEVIKTLKDYELLNLYKLKYDSVLSADELYTSGKYSVSKQTKSIQKKIDECQPLIFIFPNWWGRSPAILEGFIDKVFTPGFAYDYEGKRPVPLLRGKDAIVFITSGAPMIVTKLMGNLPKRIIKHALGFCGMKTKVYQMGGCFELTKKNKDKIKKLVTKALK